MSKVLGRPVWLLILIPLLVLSILPEAPASGIERGAGR